MIKSSLPSIVTNRVSSNMWTVKLFKTNEVLPIVIRELKSMDNDDSYFVVISTVLPLSDEMAISDIYHSFDDLFGYLDHLNSVSLDPVR